MAGVAFLDAFGGEGEVVEAGLGGDLDAVGTGFAEHGDGFDGGEMDNVELQFGGEVREGEDLGYGAGLELRRAR